MTFVPSLLAVNRAARVSVEQRDGNSSRVGSGKVLWQYAGEASSNAGAAVTKKTIYWGNGYSHLGIPEGSASTSFYAFSLNGS